MTNDIQWIILSIEGKTMMKENRKHSESILLRLTPDQKTLVQKAADKKQLQLTSWIRMILIEAAQKQLKA